MSAASVRDQPAKVGRLGIAAACISAVCCLPYLVLKVVWTLDVPLGISDRSMMHDGGWVAANALMAVVELVGLLVVLALIRPLSRRLPAWLLLVPVWVGIGLLFQIAFAALIGLLSTPSHGSDLDTGGIEPWVFVMVYTSFAGQGVALAIAFACHVRARWGSLLGRRTDQVLAEIRARARSWPESHLARSAEAVAAMALVVALVPAYWAVGGPLGLPADQPHPSAAVQIARTAGPVIAAAGLLGLAGRWGHDTRFWLPTGLVWVGSGATAAFDGFMLVLNRLFAVSAAGDPGYDWSAADALLILKVVVGLLAAGVGVVALRAAARKDTTERRPREPSRVGTAR